MRKDVHTSAPVRVFGILLIGGGVVAIGASIIMLIWTVTSILQGN